MKKRTEADIRRASGAGVARNMAGVTDEEARKALDGQAVGCLAAAACGGALAVIAVAWVSYLIAFRRPDLAAAAQPLGWASGVFGTVVAAAKLWR